MKRLGEFWWGFREFWQRGRAGVALFLVSLFVCIYGYIAADYEITQGWKGYVSIQSILKDISIFIPVGGVLVGMIVGGVDLMMLLSDWYRERLEKRIEAAKAEGIAEGRDEGVAEGRAKGVAEGKAEGRAEVYQAIAEWDRRRQEAAARGETFTEPPPGVPQNGQQ